MNAIYTVIENGRESYYSTNIAGGYSYPFLAYGYAVSMARTLNGSNSMGKVGVSEMIPLLKANENFPEDVRGERLFYPLPEEIFFTRESEMTQSDFTPFSITLDFDERTIGFVFNRNCPELPLPKINIFIGDKDARKFYDGIPCNIKNLENAYENELLWSVLERPVFVIKIDSDKIAERGSAILPLSDHNQKGLMDELETNDLDKCEVLSVTAFDKTLNAHLCLDGQPFSKLNGLANSLNKLRLDCGDSAFGAFVTAGKAAAFRSTDSAVTVIENIRNGYALRETQDMDIRM